MNIKEKLKLIESFNRAFRVIDESEATTNIEQFIEGEDIFTPYGSCLVKTTTFDELSMHGNIALADTSSITPHALAMLGKDERLNQMDLRQTVFFDTETTGLSSGTGTYIFLAGLGYYEGDRFIIKQFFLRDFNEEMPFLFAIERLLRQFTGIVSYNGKCFDLPLLQTRFIYSRFDYDVRRTLHLDLLYAVRRIWKQRLGDCSLGNIEYHVINFQRQNDVPGYMIPQIYFNYLHSGNAKPLINVFRHNILDILSLAALLIKGTAIIQSPIECLDEYADLISVAQSFQRMRQWQNCIPIYENLFQQSLCKDSKSQIALQLSYCYKRSGRWQHAAQLWQEMIATGFFTLEPYIELAKYYEHFCQDYQQALQVTNQALQALEIVEELRNIRLSRDELTYRLSRLKGKLIRKGAI